MGGGGDGGLGRSRGTRGRKTKGNLAEEETIGEPAELVTSLVSCGEVSKTKRPKVFQDNSSTPITPTPAA